LAAAPGKSRIHHEPLGVVLIYGAWNFPILLSIAPLIQAIATGNAAVVKPSEMAPACSAIIKVLVETYLDTDLYRVIEGGPEIAMVIGDHPWDMIVFTGSTMKGKLVAAAAAKNLVPCIMELGGKCPIIVDETANLILAADKVCFARFSNSGQTCIATDYVMVHESVKQRFLEILLQTIKRMWGDDPNGSDEMGKMITEGHCDRVMDLIKNSNGKIITGGKAKRDIRFIEPTVIVDPDRNSSLMKEEIFGPVLPVISFSKITEVIDHINDGDKPLAVYFFGTVRNNANKERLEFETSSGSFVTNEAITQIINHEFGFGGVGASGYGRYGGWEGFK
jgi:aldehyde dehydrogenase (NAD+)